MYPCLFSNTFSSGQIIRILAIAIIYLMTPQQYVPQIGIKLGLLLKRTTLHINFSQPLIPNTLGRTLNLIKIPMFTFPLYILTGIFLTHIRDSGLQQQLITSLKRSKTSFYARRRRLFKRRLRHGN